MKRNTIHSLSSFHFNFRFFSQIKAEKRKIWYDKDRREYLKKYANEFKITHYSQWYSVNGQKLIARPDATGFFLFI
jgi:hypothetical protein